MSTSKPLKKNKRRVKKWFSRILSVDKKNTRLKVADRKKKVQDNCRKILKNSRFWVVNSFTWRVIKPATRYHLTVFVRRRPPKGPVPPGDPTVPPPPRQPKGM